MQVFNSLMHEATEEHSLRTGRHEAVFPENHIVPGVSVVGNIVAGK